MNLDLADALHIHTLLLGQPASAVTVLGPLHRTEPGRALKTRVARFLAAFDAAQEPGERLIQPPQSGLLARKRPHRLIRAHRPDLGQLRRLIPVVDAGLAMRPGIPALLQGRVVKLAVGFHARRQRSVLARGWAQPEHVGASHDATTAHWCSR